MDLLFLLIFLSHNFFIAVIMCGKSVKIKVNSVYVLKWSDLFSYQAINSMRNLINFSSFTEFCYLPQTSDSYSGDCCHFFLNVGLGFT